jgi:hypothetical protein
VTVRSPVTAKTVRTEIQAYLGECAEKNEIPVSETYQFWRLLENRLGINYAGMRNHDQYDAVSKFRSQVLAQLNKLVVYGELEKRGDRRHLHFYVPEAAKAHDKLKEENTRKHREARQRTAGIKLRLEELGIHPRSFSSFPVQLDDENWEKLLDLAENGKALHR